MGRSQLLKEAETLRVGVMVEGGPPPLCSTIHLPHFLSGGGESWEVGRTREREREKVDGEREKGMQDVILVVFTPEFLVFLIL